MIKEFVKTKDFYLGLKIKTFPQQQTEWDRASRKEQKKARKARNLFAFRDVHSTQNICEYLTRISLQVFHSFDVNRVLQLTVRLRGGLEFKNKGRLEAFENYYYFKSWKVVIFGMRWPGICQTFLGILINEFLCKGIAK